MKPGHGWSHHSAPHRHHAERVNRGLWVPVTRVDQILSQRRTLSMSVIFRLPITRADAPAASPCCDEPSSHDCMLLLSPRSVLDEEVAQLRRKHGSEIPTCTEAPKTIKRVTSASTAPCRRVPLGFSCGAHVTGFVGKSSANKARPEGGRALGATRCAGLLLSEPACTHRAVTVRGRSVGGAQLTVGPSCRSEGGTPGQVEWHRETPICDP